MKDLLLIDDDVMFVKGMSVALGNEKRQIYIAQNVKEALEILNSHGNKMDLICSDYDMPGGTVLDLLSNIQCMGIETPVIVISGRDEESYAVEAIKMGAKAYFYKVPLDP